VSGNCYQEAYKLLQDAPPGAELVHGYPTLTAGENAGKPFGHAWVEYPDEETGQPMCLDYQRPGQPFHRALFYLVGQIDPRRCKRYAPRAADYMALRHGHYGPWGKVPRGVLFANQEIA
jgi:hypothetical protein